MNYRALELAMKQGNHIDTVLAFRQKYLQMLDVPEDKPNFLQLMKDVRKLQVNGFLNTNKR